MNTQCPKCLAKWTGSQSDVIGNGRVCLNCRPVENSHRASPSGSRRSMTDLSDDDLTTVYMLGMHDGQLKAKREQSLPSSSDSAMDDEIKENGELNHE